MSFTNIDTDIISSLVNQQMIFYELWDSSLGEFRRGEVHVHGTYFDETGLLKIYSEQVWGHSLDDAYFDEEGLLVFEKGSYIYLGPPPFNLYRLKYEDENGLKQQKLIPAESDVDLDIIAKVIANDNWFTFHQVNLDGTDYYEF
jgi:hypothetical protein